MLSFHPRCDSCLTYETDGKLSGDEGYMATDSVTAPTITPSLEEIHSSVPIPRNWWRRFLAFSGPAILISVGYMDPGNWGSDLKAGSKYGYQLLWVLVAANLMA